MGSRKQNFITAGILALAVVFIAVGVCRGEAVEVFKKATDICLACMGIAK